MHAQTSYSPEQIDAAILDLLTEEDFGLWSVAEVEREIGDRVATADSLARLVGGGLAHWLDSDFVFASHAARLARELRL